MENYFKEFISSLDCEKETNIIDECEDDVRDYLETKKMEILQGNLRYKELNKEIEKIKEDNPNVRNFIENREIIELSKDELQAILDIADKQVDLNILEMHILQFQ